MMFPLNSWQNSECFTLSSLKIHQVVQKLWFFSLDPNFWPKNCNFLQTCTIFRCYPDFLGWNWPKNFDFLTLKAYNFWTTGQIFKRQKSKTLKISSPIYWIRIWIRIRIRIRQNKLDPDPDPDPHFKIRIQHTGAKS